MLISKTNFLEFITFERAAEAYLKKGPIREVEELAKLEENENIKDIMGSLMDEDLSTADIQLETFMDQYNQLEKIVATKAAEKFGVEVQHNIETFKQKRFSYNDGNDTFFCFLDGYQEDEDTIRVFEVKASTTSRFSADNDGFYFGSTIEGQRKKQRNEFFIPDEKGIMIPFGAVPGNELPDGNDYDKKLESLYNRTNDRGKFLYDLAYQKYVIENSIKDNTKKIEYYLVLLNHKYIYDGKKDSKGNPIYGDDLVVFYNMSSVLDGMNDIIEQDIQTVKDRLENKHDMGSLPLTRVDLDSTFGDDRLERFPEKNSILTLTDRHYGFKTSDGEEKYSILELINDKGYTSILDVPLELLNRKNNIIQREAVESGEPYVNKEKIKKGLELLQYPIYHLDFETMNSPLPRFKGEKPYDQSLFQFSIHIERELGIMDFEKDNVSYLAGDHEDHRRNIVEGLIDTIKPDGGTVLVYHAPFERGRIEELQILFPEYSDELQDIKDRIFDLLDLVRGNRKMYEELGFDKDEASEYNFYHEDMQGSFSIKKVLPVFSELSYDSMDVGNGTEAMFAYSKLPELSKEEHERVYNSLLEYCKQDTWAMFEVLNGLRKLVD